MMGERRGDGFSSMVADVISNMSPRICQILALAVALLPTRGAHAQLRLPSLGSTLSPITRAPVLQRVRPLVDAVLAPVDLATARLDDATRRVRAHRRELDRDPRGELIVRAEVLAQPSGPRRAMRCGPPASALARGRAGRTGRRAGRDEGAVRRRSRGGGGAGARDRPGRRVRLPSCLSGQRQRRRGAAAPPRPRPPRRATRRPARRCGRPDRQRRRRGAPRLPPRRRPAPRLRRRRASGAARHGGGVADGGRRRRTSIRRCRTRCCTPATSTATRPPAARWRRSRASWRGWRACTWPSSTSAWSARPTRYCSGSSSARSRRAC